MVDLSSLLSLVQEIALAIGGVLATALVGFLVVWIKRKTGIDVDDRATRDAIEQGLHRAITYAATEVMSKLGPDASKVAIKNELIRLAVDYASRTIPQSLKHFGITPEKIADMVKARLDDIVEIDALPRPTP